MGQRWHLWVNRRYPLVKKPGFVRIYLYWQSSDKQRHPTWPPEKVDVPLAIAEIV